ncbi:hypothetical protein DPEC_G00350970 [Dallia pectoralis]|uniref:Uncharacterized protein n=1 Tax=Dallia pectoralis TaxID=75939 RepID=A0ACC2F1V6_DALPE|nr:hypothetical protein DPEC_G00350970 [Dallia pectoralis]
MISLDIDKLVFPPPVLVLTTSVLVRFQRDVMGQSIETHAVWFLHIFTSPNEQLIKNYLSSPPVALDGRFSAENVVRCRQCRLAPSPPPEKEPSRAVLKARLESGSPTTMSYQGFRGDNTASEVLTFCHTSRATGDKEAVSLRANSPAVPGVRREPASPILPARRTAARRPAYVTGEDGGLSRRCKGQRAGRASSHTSRCPSADDLQ